MKDRKKGRPPATNKCRVGCPAPELDRDHRALKDRLHAMQWGVGADTHDLAHELNDALHILADLADPYGSGVFGEASDRTKAALAVRAPGSTLAERIARNAGDRLIKDVRHAINTALVNGTRDPDDEHETPTNGHRPRCATPGCRGRQPRNQAPHCPWCGANFTPTEPT